ncbi:MAG: hypothetical protein M0R50_08710 [Candidatus Cloacimonetes bacterium]|jgi:hypothetical protein|nr:hypothetical protein [Candidatus Cloacimonadota bacterium]
MADKDLPELYSTLGRLLAARDNHEAHAATHSAFNRLIRSVRSKIKRIEKMKPDDKLEKSHTPSSLKPDKIVYRKEVIYATGYEKAPLSFGMWAGPTPILAEMLEMVPNGPNPCIIRFNIDGTDDVLYRWDDKHNDWRLVCQNTK